MDRSLLDHPAFERRLTPEHRNLRERALDTFQPHRLREWMAGPGGYLAKAQWEELGRLGFLSQVGLGYLTLDRPTRTLSGGEFQRSRLAGCLGSGLTGVCYILDEPTIGLHPRDTRRLLADTHPAGPFLASTKRVAACRITRSR